MGNSDEPSSSADHAVAQELLLSSLGQPSERLDRRVRPHHRPRLATNTLHRSVTRSRLLLRRRRPRGVGCARPRFCLGRGGMVLKHDPRGILPALRQDPRVGAARRASPSAKTVRGSVERAPRRGARAEGKQHRGRGGRRGGE